MNTDASFSAQTASYSSYVPSSSHSDLVLIPSMMNENGKFENEQNNLRELIMAKKNAN